MGYDSSILIKKSEIPVVKKLLLDDGFEIYDKKSVSIIDFPL